MSLPRVAIDASSLGSVGGATLSFGGLGVVATLFVYQALIEDSMVSARQVSAC